MFVPSIFKIIFCFEYEYITKCINCFIVVFGKKSGKKSGKKLGKEFVLFLFAYFLGKKLGYIFFSILSSNLLYR